MMLVNTEKKKLFRENALKELNQLGTLETTLNIVPVSAVAYLTVALLAILALIGWAICGVIEVEVPVQGMILNAGEMTAIEQRYQSYRHEQAKTRQTLKYLMEKKQDLYAKHYLTLDELQLARQAYLQAEGNMASMPQLNGRETQNLFTDSAENASGNTELQALVFVSHGQGKQIVAGMQAYILPSYLSYYKYGYLKGTVLQISLFPISREVAYGYLGNMNLVD